MSIFERLSFKQQLLLFFSAGILILLAVSSYVQFITAESSLREKQIEQGLKVSQNLATQSVLALIFDSESNARDALQSFLDFPDVVMAEIIRYDQSSLFFDGEESYRTNLTLENILEPALIHETDRGWYFVAPVLQLSDEASPFEDIDQTEEIIGYVGLVVSKESLQRNANEHLVANITSSTGLAILFLLLLMWLSTSLTSPIRNLVDVMKKVEGGERDVRAELSGPADVKKIVAAFNKMVKAREAEEIQIKMAHDMAVEAAKMKGDFAANVSHELRTPMNGILGMLDVMRGAGNLNQKQNEYLEVIYSSSNALLDLINDILDFTKIDSGKIDIVADDFYLIDVVQNVIDLLSGQAQRKDIELGVVMDPNIPDLVNGDSNRVRQVLMNLVGNAIKFTDEGEVVVRVELEDEKPERLTYKILVEDTGIGFKQDSLDKIYEPFAQLDASPTRKYGGSGLGLTISRQLIDILGGEMGAESREGEGSTFWFTIPLQAAKNEPRFNIEKHRPEVAGLRVLVVDDSVVSRHALTTILNKWEAYQQTAPTGQAALTKLKQAANKSKAFDFIIIDHQMKSMNYEDLIAQIHGNADLNLTRIIMTINASALGRADALRKGVDGIIEKPVRDIKLYQCITSIMNSQSLPEFKDVKQEELLPVKRKVLVVEDTKTNQIVIEEILLQLGCEVEIATNGQDAIDNYFTRQYDLIFMDCRMPVMDGYSATRHYRKTELQGSHTPIVAMTANTSKDDQQHCIDAGMDDYLPKPLSIESVKEILLKWANNPQQILPEPAKPEETPDDFEITDFNIDNEVGAVEQGVLIETGYHNLINSLGAKAALRMSEVFSEELPDKLQELSNAAAQHDRKLITEIAHSLKSSSQHFGAKDFAELAKQIEHTARSENMEILTGQISTLCEKAYPLRAEIDRILEQEKSKLQTEVRYKVLVVDDNETDQIALVSSLRNNNLSVDVARNGTEAIEYCQKKLPDLVMLDAMMPEADNPDMDGFVACRMIKQLPGAQNVPVLMVTGLDDEMSVNKAINAGASDFITKPVNLSVLQRRVKQLLVMSHSERRLQRIAYTDSLTGLPNRPYFIDRMASHIKGGTQGGYTAILFLGLDQFKLINDAIGHATGDILLQSVAKRLKALTSDHVFVARTGGDEFSVILQNFADMEAVETFAQNIRYEISQPFYIQRETINISASIGISVYPTHGKDVSLLMKRADTAMFYAKESQKGYLFFDNDMAARATRRLKVLSGLRDAIHNDQLVMNYQPQLAVDEQKITGCEALVRWNSPHHGTIFPEEFIAYAEESGLIAELGEWVMLTACKQLQDWESSGFKNLKMAINLSGRQLEQEDFLNRVAEILNQTGVQASQLEFEITESSLMNNPEESVEILNQMREMGIDIAIDDFGTGYNTLAHLEKYPIDTIKIDKSFTQNIKDEQLPSVIQGIISFAKGLDYKVVAEGVETEQQKEYLENLDCDYLQGHLVGKPMTAALFEQSILRKHKQSEKQPELGVTPITKNIKTKKR